jgi:hypothetical protein
VVGFTYDWLRYECHLGHVGWDKDLLIYLASLINERIESDKPVERTVQFATFADEIGGIEYSSLLPADQAPPTDLNRALMEKHREAMRAHYPKKRPRFAD